MKAPIILIVGSSGKIDKKDVMIPQLKLNSLSKGKVYSDSSDYPVGFYELH